MQGNTHKACPGQGGPESLQSPALPDSGHVTPHPPPPGCRRGARAAPRECGLHSTRAHWAFLSYSAPGRARQPPPLGVMGARRTLTTNRGGRAAGQEGSAGTCSQQQLGTPPTAEAPRRRLRSAPFAAVDLEMSALGPRGRERASRLPLLSSNGLHARLPGSQAPLLGSQSPPFDGAWPGSAQRGRWLGEVRPRQSGRPGPQTGAAALARR